jgi:PAS domain S-box-containing protein
MLDLRARLEELEATLAAIRSGEVDALIVNGPNGDQVYSLKGAEQPYREFIERMGEGAVTVEPDGTILYCNQRFADMIQKPLERLISTNLLDYAATDDKGTVETMVTGKEPASSTVYLQMKKGKLLPVQMAVSMLESAGSGVRCVVFTDLTEQHQRRTLAEALARVQANQAQLQKQNEELQAARAALEAANAAKDEFLAALSHELRTPLTPVLLTANAIAVDPSFPKELRNDAEMIRRNVELEARLIDDLLDLTRITRGKLQITPRTTDLHETLQLALDICQADTAAKRVRFVTRLDATFHHVSGEMVRLQQIFWNLIRNAVKFTPATGEITVTTRNARPANNDGGEGSRTPDVIVSITDTGIGIEKAALERIFDAFEQGSGEITRRFGGLGLGLTISKRLVELHKGTISVQSRGENKGATFEVRFPTVAMAVGDQDRPSTTLQRKVPPLRILLVEDHDDTRRNMTRLLTALGHTVISAHDAGAALSQAATERFDLVVSDIGLPDESGLVLMTKLREKYGLKGICLSGYGMEEDVARSMAAGFSEHLTKPINFERLEGAIASLAVGKSSTRC